MSDAQALAATPDAPSQPAWSAYLKRTPDRLAEIESLRPGRATPGIDAIAANFDPMLRLLEQGHSPESAGKELGIFGRRIHDYLRANPDKRPAYVAALKKRERSPNKRGTRISKEFKRKRFTAEQFDSAVEFIRDHRGMDLSGALLNRRDLPALESIIFRANRNPAFAARYAKAMATHAMANAYVYIRDTGVAPSLLLSSLMQQPLYATAWKHFRKLEDRDDLISEVVLAVLEGEISSDDIGKRDTFKRIRKRANARVIESLDVPAFHGRDSDSRDSLGDTLANDTAIFHY
ncbi:hypothetical protein Nham_1714 [Nitrobacter hamburgensis X14]|uniref:Uncharacterized protein n=1 Tax=Nitrobacter hamburgensis (strain DSM 10229 / NCIMB 13809 / X14) TaxID=323097 RepID=Q1QML7_NITHX|nr:hypothetical protein [Nitrobacter hamburgensis]ABE62530.1 hypothetical protein Nham_1714 [Nitrobacter hamburgensis X14]